MTSEQNAEWQACIEPLEYRDGHAITPAGLMRCARDLTRKGVPFWAMRLRQDMGDICREAGGADTLNFALRSEVALAGLLFLYPDAKEAEVVYRRAYLGFVHALLQPLVEWAQQGSEKRQKDCASLLALSEQCTTFTGPIEQVAWERVAVLGRYSLEGYGSPEDQAEADRVSGIGALVQGVYGELRLVLDLFHMRHVPIKEWLERADHVYQLLDGKSDPVHWSVRKGHPARQVVHQGRQITLPAREDRFVVVYAETIADLFVAALEKECPPPDWIARL